MNLKFISQFIKKPDAKTEGLTHYRFSVRFAIKNTVHETKIQLLSFRFFSVCGVFSVH